LAIANISNRMKEKRDLTKELLDQLLDWLDQNRDRAGQKYELIRSRLIKIFVCRGCIVPEELADETINRVAIKVPQIAGTYIGNPLLYFHGVADKIFLEYLRKMPAPLPIATCRPGVELLPGPCEDVEPRYGCLEQCVERLSVENRKLILVYYGGQGQRKIEMRKELAHQLGIRANALWIRAHRIREVLRKCVGECLTRKQVLGNRFKNAGSNNSSQGVS
jgi:DNA-directed RNA polymerase specialized sigma24 family protein